MLRQSWRRRSPSGYPPRHHATRNISSHAYPELPFNPPPIRQRLRPLIPFFFYWTVITSLTVHLMRTRVSASEELAKAKAQVTVLEGLIRRFQAGEKVGPGEIRRELEMVGLRERVLTKELEKSVQPRDVGWREAIFGKRTTSEQTEQEDEAKAVKDWVDVINETSRTSDPPAVSTAPRPAERSGSTQRAPSAKVYM